ncbi:MAG TPA: 1-deoxy-D-xylulose-5-phosphate reductoisomerase [Candidatus Acidoferrales bacterium]|nr:1-deoxy-D-xylulose-5-phosphate reductoisomerase [Candidatus Acidoferrales bacterium]
MKKEIAILGSTGSIGRSSLDVISSLNEQGEDYRVAYLVANKNIDLLYQQVKTYKPVGVVVIDEQQAIRFCSYLNGEKLKVLSGEKGLMDIMAGGEFDILVSSLVGFVGLRPTLEALRAGKKVALANKETMVVAGEIVNETVKRCNTTLLPIDSEHSAIMQCLSGERRESVARLILTASGGPFLNRDKCELENVTVEEALNHPKWKMGNKITIDSATLMNKGLEVIEAHYLFGLPAEKIEIVIHPQSVIHSMVEFVDGSIKAQLGMPDMKIPIQYALSYPERVKSNYERVDFAKISQLTFMKPDEEKFSLIKLAYEALRAGGTATAILNAANEAAVDLFLQRKIKFTKIAALVEEGLQSIPIKSSPAIEEIFEADRAARLFVYSDTEHT